MKYSVKYTAQFKKELKIAVKRGYDPNEIHYVIDLIAEGTNSLLLSSKYSDHALKGKWRGYRECHIRPDWLLIYEIIEDILVLSLARTGTHSDLFDR
ncbi:MAG: type II toxin-antitoxin system YafQ family toxin [Ruminococcus sp.]|nr:type II toxin-antitoxin system YafQ family toxin [Ruminococcus sp.]MCM1382244.1 type II toxin-antitoxin system YafQ family toxin [Muribaculaceae bacterium]MCM1479942.1 type II toxin-antitoxin system YafQ family toxin [Muribaculaceae bacterium]